MAMTPEQEARHALSYGISRSDLSLGAQIEYDRLAAEGREDSWLLVLLAVATVTLAAQVLLTAQPGAGLLFPLGTWFSVQIWRAMQKPRRPLPVRAAADIVLSLLLGAELVLALVWLANLLDLTEPEVAFLRGALELVGS